MATDLLTLAEGALLTQFLTPTGKHYGEVLLKRVQQLEGKALEMLARVGRKPQPVADNVLHPLVQAAALEANPGLSERWAALLANAAGAADMAIKPVYAEILRQLVPEEATILDLLFEESDRGIPTGIPHLDSDAARAAYRKSDAVGRMLDLQHVHHNMNRAKNIQSFTTGGLSSQLEFSSSVDNLLRLQLIIPTKGKPLAEKPSFHSDYEPERDNVFLTSLGYDFMLACIPPHDITPTQKASALVNA